MGKYGQFNYGEDVYGGSGSPGPSPTPPSESVRVAWTFFDGINSYDLPINPSEATMPYRTRNITSKPTCSGRQVLYEGRVNVPEISFSGTLLDEEQFRAMWNWFRKRKQIRITDDLGRKYWVYLKTFDPVRVKNDENPWHHTYTASGVWLDRG